MRMQSKLLAALMAAGMITTSGAACAADAADSWVSAPGFEAVDVDAVESREYYAPERFPDSGSSVFYPDADLAAPVRALLLVEHLEGLLPHARYRVGWHVVEDAQVPDRMVHQVQVHRFNLGSARREDLRAYVSEEHLAPLESFGEGPDVAWRFTMAPRQGMQAGVEAASRKVLDDAQAAAADCLGTPCLELQSAAGPESTDWHPREVTAPSPGYQAQAGSGPHPARVMEDLVAAIGGEAEMPVAPREEPRFVFVVSSNVEGQDLMTTALGRDSVVLDDAIGTVWVRWLQFGDGQPESTLLLEPRRR